MTVPGKSRGRGRAIEPVVLALVLGLVSVWPVASALQTPPFDYAVEGIGWPPMGTGQAIVLALAAVLPAAFLGGVAGGWAWPRRPSVGPVLALTVAWCAGIVILPMAAAVLGVPLRNGLACVDACESLLRDDRPLGGFLAYAEILMTAPFAFYLLVVPAVLLIAARATRRRVLWIAMWLSGHAAINAFAIIGSGRVPYLALTSGVVLWTGWLWARDLALGGFGSPIGRWAAALAPAAVVIAIGATVLSAAWVPAVPREASRTVVGTIRLTGAIAPDVSATQPWTPWQLVPRSPSGVGCFEPLVRPEGRLTLCWNAYRDPRDRDASSDDYQLRLHGTFSGADPADPGWMAIEIRPTDPKTTRLSFIWPTGVTDGPCEIVDVEGHGDAGVGPNERTSEPICGRTLAWRQEGTQHVIWQCVACAPASPGGRPIAAHELLHVDEGVVPSWEVRADFGQ